MKKVFKFLVLIVICFSSLFSFGCKENKDTLNIFMPDGAPALSMAKLLHENEQFGFNTKYSVVSATNISNYILNKEADIAIMPINMASKILKDGENYKILATVTNGNLYIVGNRSINNLSDLKNEKVGVIGQGNVPDLTFKYLLNSNDIEYAISENNIENKVALTYFSEASNLIPSLIQGKLSFGLLPEPAVSKLLSMSDNFKIQLDIQSLWEGGSYPQAVLVVKNTLIENNNFIDDLLSSLDANEEWILENTTDAINAINDNLLEGVVPTLSNTISVNAIENCNIKIHSTKEEGEIDRMTDYLEKIRIINDKAIGSYTDNLFVKYE
jgi:NitT/TauT family transport system substrate-binding protein